MHETLGEMCRNCGCFHDDIFEKYHSKDEADGLRTVCINFRPERPCQLCHKPVLFLSMGGPTICPWCDCGRPEWREESVQRSEL